MRAWFGSIAGVTFLKRLANLLRPKPSPPLPSIRVTAEGIELLQGGESLAMQQWIHVNRIIAYKCDRFVVDEIRIGFLEHPSSDRWFEISEEYGGYSLALDQIHARFPSIPKNWFSQVAQPPFERNETVLWDAVGGAIGSTAEDSSSSEAPGG